MRARWILLVVALLANALVATALLVRWSYAPRPSRGQLANPERYPLPGAYDLLGRIVTSREARTLAATEDGAALLTPEAGAIPLSEGLVEEGRDIFYRETFGSDLFLTEVVGILDGGLTAWDFGRALLSLAGRGTSDLKVRMSRDVQAGDQLFRTGTVVSTGLDVPRGSWLPLGVRIFYERGRIRAGITCALCHAAVDPDSGLVVEGAPNTNLNAGLLLALASNSAAFSLQGTVPPLDPYLGEDSPTVRSSTGVYTQLPQPDAFETGVSERLLNWPPGSFDTTLDGLNNPTSIPDCFTAEAHPYGWTGHAAVGPFRGLSALTYDGHALQADATALADAMPLLSGLDPEVYLGILLQRAAHPSYRFDPQGDRQPSQVLAEVTKAPDSPGLARFAVLPSYPRANYLSLVSLVSARSNETVGHAHNALAAFQNSLKAPPRFALNAEGIERGRRVFQNAGCAECHGGRGWTNHVVIPVEGVQSEPSRARGLAASADSVVPPALFAPNTPYPPPPDAPLLLLDLTPEQLDLLRLGWAHGTNGGYKVKGLVGLEWSAPYLHDGGIAVGADPSEEVGIPGTIGLNRPPDPRNSLLALIDRGLRRRVIRANRENPALVEARVTGRGHYYWVDSESGHSRREQQALIDYLLSLRAVMPR